jgi:hypothetical protein
MRRAPETAALMRKPNARSSLRSAVSRAVRLLALACAACLLVPAVGALARTAETAPKRCRDVVLLTGSGAVYARTHRLRAQHASCRLARRVARKYLHGNEGERRLAPFGFHCRNDSRAVVCRRGDRRVRWHW